jgi:hypothetical protein
MRHRQSQVLSVDIPNHIKAGVVELLGAIAEFMQKNENEIMQSFLTEGRVRLDLDIHTSKDYPKECGEFLFNWIYETFKTIVYPAFTYDMALTHTVTTLEAFLSDFLVVIFTQRPSTLKSQNSATFEQILSYSSMKQLINALAISRAKSTMDENIDTIGKNLEDTFSIDITTLNGFDIIREASYRRNIIVHNKGKTDKKYCNKIPNSGIGVRLSTDSQYVGAAITAVGQFIDCLDNCFSLKIHYNKDPMANRILHPEAILSIEQIDDSSSKDK